MQLFYFEIRFKIRTYLIDISVRYFKGKNNLIKNTINLRAILIREMLNKESYGL